MRRFGEPLDRGESPVPLPGEVSHGPGGLVKTVGFYLVENLPALFAPADLGASFYTFVFLGILYMQQVLRFSALATGAAWMTASLTSLACAGLSQKIVTRTSAKAVMASGMTLIGTGILWAAQAPSNGSFWRDLAGPFLIAGIGTAAAFIPISIGALTGVTDRDAGVACGLLSTSQNLGGAIGVAVASSIAASHSHTLIHQGYATAAALTGGFQCALWVCGLTGLAAIPVALTIIRRAASTRSAR